MQALLAAGARPDQDNKECVQALTAAGIRPAQGLVECVPLLRAQPSEAVQHPGAMGRHEAGGLPSGLPGPAHAEMIPGVLLEAHERKQERCR